MIESRTIADPRAWAFGVASLAMDKAPALQDVLSANVEALCRQRGFWRPGQDQPNQSALKRAIKGARGHLNQATVSRVLQGDRMTKLSTLDALAAGLGVPAWVLLVPRLNAAETPLLTTVEALERARLAASGSGYRETEEQQRRSPARGGVGRDRQKPRARAKGKTTKTGAD